MKPPSWRTKLGIALVALSLVLFAAHYAIFTDFHHIAIYTLQDVAFLPLEVLIVTIIIHELLERRAREDRLDKLNMVIGAFFSEAGTDLLRLLQATSPGDEGALAVRTDWTERDFAEAKKAFSEFPPRLEMDAAGLAALRSSLVAKRGFLLRLLENPNLLEHESFTDLLWATFHLAEELEHRGNLEGLPRTDVEHLAGDSARVYSLLVVEWLDHARHLQRMYPYLFSLLVRTNPFDPAASVEVR